MIALTEEQLADLCAVIDGIGTGPDDRESLQLVLEALATGAEQPLSVHAQAALWRMANEEQLQQPTPGQRLLMVVPAHGAPLDLSAAEF